MSTRSVRTRSAIAVAAALATGLLITIAGPASAAPTSPSDTDGGHTRSIQLSWDGKEYADSTTESFLGTPVSVPGDTTANTLLVRNDGPTDATLRATITNVDLLNPDAADVQHHPDHVAPDDSGLYAGAGDQGNFYDDLHIDWHHGQASMNELAANGQTRILQVPLARGEEVPISIDYELPLAATSGNHANVAERLASFDVVLELGGTFPTEPTPAPVPMPGAAPASPTSPPAMPETGADLRGPALVVAVLLALGGVLVHASRRKEDVRGHH